MKLGIGIAILLGTATLAGCGDIYTCTDKQGKLYRCSLAEHDKQAQTAGNSWGTPGTATKTQCCAETVPAGGVLTNQIVDLSCSYDHLRCTYTDPGSYGIGATMTVCSGWPCPYNWIRVGKSTSSYQCVGTPGADNLSEMRRFDGLPSGTTISVCDDYPRPTGWTVTNGPYIGSACHNSQMIDITRQ